MGFFAMRLLVLEGNTDCAQFLIKSFDQAGFAADVVATAECVHTALSAIHYGAIVLDLGLPDGDGLSILREIREREDPTPVIVLSERTDVHDRIAGLRSGADDYIVKPVEFDELVARLEAVLRRPGQVVGRSLSIGNLVLDSHGRQAFIDGKPQILSAREIAVLEVLMQRSGRIVPKKAVVELVFGPSSNLASNAVVVYIHRLRKCLAEAGANVIIHNKRGVGYLIAEDK